MPLNENQQRAVEVLDWLWDMSENSRRSGRTTVMAIGYIRQAAHSPGRWVDVQDHIYTRRLAEHMAQTVRALVMADPNLRNFLEQRSTNGQFQFRLNLNEPLEDWLPGGVLAPVRLSEEVRQQLGETRKHLQTVLAQLDESIPPEPKRSRYDMILED